MDLTAGILECGLYLLVLIALAVPLGEGMARVFSGTPGPVMRAFLPVERFLLRLAGSAPTKTCPGSATRPPSSSFNFVGAVVLFKLQRVQAFPSAESRRSRQRESRDLLQHRGELRHEHELAGVRRRDHDELPHANAGAHGAELRLGGDRNRGAGRRHPRVHAPHRQRHRQLLGRSRAQHALRLAAAFLRLGTRARGAGRRADVRAGGARHVPGSSALGRGSARSRSKSSRADPWRRRSRSSSSARTAADSSM